MFVTQNELFEESIYVKGQVLKLLNMKIFKLSDVIGIIRC